jgi:hypothetical protein
MRFTRYLAAAALVGAVAGCNDLGVEVENKNNPDRPRVLATAADVEGLAAAQFQQVLAGTIGNSLTRVQLGMLVMAFENATALANNGMSARGSIPRQPIDNTRGNAYAAENFSTFQTLSTVGRNTADVLARANAADFKLSGGEGDLNRLKAWTHFISGVSHGYLSLTYDSAAIARASDEPLYIPPLEGYQAVNAFALAELDSALVYLAKPGTTALPAGWLTGPTGATVTPARFTQIVRSFQARLRAGVARTPAERAAVDWDKVIADATAGITSDLVVAMDRNKSWDYQWLHTSYHYRDANWHQMGYNIIGMADVSGAFDTWLSQPRAAKVPFLIITPDKRFPQGATRALQNDDRGGQKAPTEGKYFRNRAAGLDPAGMGWEQSQYDHYRFRAFASACVVADPPIFTRAENYMLAAEGYIRKGNFAAAATLIDRTRTANGLPALSGAITAADQAVPGGSQCVPRIPVGPNFTSTACGTIMEAMKWEKRLEMAYTAFGGWYFDSRGWGDLPEGTAVQWPVPVQELDARRVPLYNLGGIGKDGGAGPSTYGYGTGDR